MNSFNTLDVYRPKRVKLSAKLPVIVYIHSGGWTKGDKSNVHLKPKFFNENESVFVSVKYRLATKNQYPS